MGEGTGGDSALRAGSHQVWLDAGESLRLVLDRCAVLTGVIVPDTADSVSASEALRTRVVDSVAIDELVRTSQIVVDDSGPVGHGEEGQRAWPTDLVVTSAKVLALGAGDRVWSWPLEEIVEVVHSITEPCTVIRSSRLETFAVLVPPADAAALRGTLDELLTPSQLPAAEITPAPRQARKPVIRVGEFGDRVFRGVSWLGGLSVLAIMTLVGLFLAVRATSALRATGFRFLTTSEWQPDTHHFGIAAVLQGTVVIAIVALAASVPLALGTSLFISEVAPRRLKRTFVSMIDLMAAVPSVVYGLWGFKFLQPHVIGVSRWISTWLSWIPIFKVEGANPRDPLTTQTIYTASAFIAGLVVALMVIPIACAIMREVFAQAPAGEREGAYALGATRWGMIRAVVLPFGRGGMIGAVMLGLGRALGETIAVVLIISPVFKVNWHLMQTGTNSVSALIVLRQGDASGFGLSALMAAGLALFVLTLVVNFSASIVVARARSGAQSEV